MKTCFLSVLLLTLAACPAAADLSRHVLIVANNQDPDGELAPLRYADDDGVRYAELFEAAGARVELLTTLDDDSQRVFPGLASRTRPPTKARFAAALKHIFDDIRHDKKEGRRTELIFVYTGHGKIAGGQGQMLLTDGKMSRDELFSRLVEASPADSNLLILDACHAYFLVLPRGGWRDDEGLPADKNAMRAFLHGPNRLDRLPTTGVILSTAGATEVHEWSHLRGGIFSHELRSALLGLGDVDGDRRVDYSEVEAFLAAANAGVTNPKARIQFFVQAPAQNRAQAVLDLNAPGFSHFLNFSRQSAGRFEVEDARGLAYATWNKAADHDSSLALLFSPVRKQPAYFVRQEQREARIALPQAGDGRLELAWAEQTLSQARKESRGSVEESFRSQLFAVPYGSAFAEGYAASRREAPLELSAPRPEARANSHSLSLGYVLSDATMESDGLAHGGQLAYRWQFWRYLLLALRFGWTHTESRSEGSERSLDAMGLDLGLGADFRLTERLHLWSLASLGNRFLLQSESAPNASVHRKDSSDLFAPAIGAELGLRLAVAGPLGLELAGGLDLVFGSIEGEATRSLLPWGRAAILFSF